MRSVPFMRHSCGSKEGWEGGGVGRIGAEPHERKALELSQGLRGGSCSSLSLAGAGSVLSPILGQICSLAP